MHDRIHIVRNIIGVQRLLALRAKPHLVFVFHIIDSDADAFISFRMLMFVIQAQRMAEFVHHGGFLAEMANVTILHA